MRIAYIADGRSPIATNWVSYFVNQGHEVHLVSTFECQPELNLASLNLLPVALSNMKSNSGESKRVSHKGIWTASLVGLRTKVRQWIGPLTLPKAAEKLSDLIDHLDPDLVHALRIPFEGMVASLALEGGDFLRIPLLISVWGNDFTLHAPTTPWMGGGTRRSMKRANGVHTDCRRDLHLAHQWGFPQDGPAIVLPGAGGVQPEIFYPPSNPDQRLSTKGPQVINPRGFRAYVRNDTFFRAIPMVLRSHPKAHFICPDMLGEVKAEQRVERLGIKASVSLLPKQTRPEMARLFRQSMVMVSPSEHDGTPNTLLEAMACGCFPVAGDLPSLREWITSGENGLLVSPQDPCALADAIVQAIENTRMRWGAYQYNLDLIADKAVYPRVMAKAERFYESLVGG